MKNKKKTHTVIGKSIGRFLDVKIQPGKGEVGGGGGEAKIVKIRIQGKELFVVKMVTIL